MGLIVNQVALAEIMGVTKKSISLWQAEGLPVAVKGVRGKPNAYDTAEVITWFAARTAGKSLETQKDRLSRVQADRIEMEMATSRGHLVYAAEIAPAWAGIMVAVRQALLSIPASIRSLLDAAVNGDERHAILKEAIEDALRKLAGDDESSASGPYPLDDGDAGATVEDVSV